MFPAFSCMKPTWAPERGKDAIRGRMPEIERVPGVLKTGVVFLGGPFEPRFGGLRVQQGCHADESILSGLLLEASRGAGSFMWQARRHWRVRAVVTLFATQGRVALKPTET